MTRTRIWRAMSAFVNPERRFADRVRAIKQARAEQFAYIEHPRVSLIVLSFNHRRNIGPIVDGLRRTIAEEIIVCEDGSIDGSEREWQRRLERPNDFLIRSNDIHDSRAYNRAASYARGEIICVLQDDDIPPSTGRWVEDALKLFDAYPALAVLGGHQGWVLDLSKPADRVNAREVFGYREARRFAYARDIPFREPALGMPMMFVQGVSIGPIFYRRTVFQQLGGFNLDYSAAGEVGMLVDHELSLRAWLAGHHVAVYGPVPFQRYVGGQGTIMFGREARERNLLRSFVRLQHEYADRVAAIDARAAALNARLTPMESSP